MTRKPRRDPPFLHPAAPAALHGSRTVRGFGGKRRRPVDQIGFGARRAWHRRSRRPVHARRRRAALAVLVACALLPAVLVAAGSDGERGGPPSDASASAEGTASPPRKDPLTPGSLSGSGSLATVAGTSAPAGPGHARFTVEVERGLRIDRRAFARAVEQTLLDRRSWAAQGGFGLRRVDTGPVDFSVVLAGPDTTDELCAPLETDGVYSCYMDAKAVINARNWARGAPSYRDQLARYRRYVVNHEVGHALGHDHLGCPGRGEPAPVMVQQTKGLDGCRANPWPLPGEL